MAVLRRCAMMMGRSRSTPTTRFVLDPSLSDRGRRSFDKTSTQQLVLFGSSKKEEWSERGRRGKGEKRRGKKLTHERDALLSSSIARLLRTPH